MFDGFWSGLLGGLFGPVITRRLGGYKYWTIFLFVMLGVHIAAFAAGACLKGLPFALKAVSEKTFSPVGILAPIAIALLAVFVVFIVSLIHMREMPKTNSK